MNLSHGSKESISDRLQAHSWIKRPKGLCFFMLSHEHRELEKQRRGSSFSVIKNAPSQAAETGTPRAAD